MKVFATNTLWLAFLVLLTIEAVSAARKDKKSRKKKSAELKDDKEEEMPEEEKFLVTKTAFFDIEIDDEPSGRIQIGLFGEAAPISALNFGLLSKGNYKGDDGFGYKGCLIHRIVQDFVIQGGDITVGDGSGGKSIYGGEYADEPFVLGHDASGYLSMANRGKDTNSSQFFILLNKARHLDGRHVVFGKVVEGMDIVEKIADLEVNEYGFPKKLVRISESGLIQHKAFVLPKEQR